MTTTSHRWLLDAEQLIRCICPDMKGIPIYLVDFQEVETTAPELRAGLNLGWTSKVCDLLLCDYLSQQGRWKGRGFAAVIQCSLLPARRYLLGVVLHELAHYLTFKPMQDKLPVLPERQLSLELLSWLPKSWALPEPDPEETSSNLPRWYGHESEFIRTASHLAHRAEQVVAAVKPMHLNFGKAYYGSLFSELTWMTTLQTELDNTAETIREILAQAAPEQFQKLWQCATGVGEV